MTSGESPLQCALREVHEEVGLALQPQQLHLWALVTEKNYCGHGHWLLFIYEAQVELEALPPAIDEGHFGFFPLADIAAGQVPIPPSDGQLLWGLYPQWRRGLVVLRAVWPEPCGEPAAMHVTLEASYPPSC
jgi:8-oxo-dGTP diphosphatase